jgi:hypothetical protein
MTDFMNRQETDNQSNMIDSQPEGQSTVLTKEETLRLRSKHIG